MRKVIITDECLNFIDGQNERVSRKFYELIEVITHIQIVHQKYIKKLKNTEFYELRIRAGNEYRVIILSSDHENFNQSSRIICLWSFIKKSNRDYDKAIRRTRLILNNYKEENNGEIT